MKTLALVTGIMMTLNQAQACTDFTGFYKSDNGLDFHFTQVKCDYVIMEMSDADGKVYSLTYKRDSKKDYDKSYPNYTFTICRDGALLLHHILNDQKSMLFGVEKFDSGDIKYFTSEYKNGKTINNTPHLLTKK